MTDKLEKDITEGDAQNIDIQEEDGFRFHRGSALSIFGSDRKEDMMALLLALLIAAGVYLLVP